MSDSFRDSISTVDEAGKRVWIFPKKPAGKYYTKRKLVSYFLLVFLFAGPYLRIGGEPLLLLDVVNRKFVLFGQIFWPQDFHLFALAMIIGVVSVTLFTVVYGRLFCGWVCPQTIFMEMLFRRIEYWIDGDFGQQKRLNKSRWTTEKISKRLLKHGIFLLLSFFIANTFLAYLIGSEQLWIIITDSPADHLGGLLSIVAFTLVFYFVFSWLREQVCTTICPYGRLQGVLLDRDSIVVAYDHKRGESRGRFRKNENRQDANKGDCVDCGLCVKVCPVGIDIRNGTQLECTNCTACIDECDTMMEKTGLDGGLIRYASEEGIVSGKNWSLTSRAKAYTAVLVLLSIGFVSLLVMRSDMEATILRTRGTMYQKLKDGQYSNMYDLILVNKTNQSFPIELKVLEGKGELKLIGKAKELAPGEEVTNKFMLIMAPEEVDNNTGFTIGIYSKGELIEQVKTNFVGPIL